MHTSVCMWNLHIWRQHCVPLHTLPFTNAACIEIRFLCVYRFVRELMTVRDKCIAEEIETPNLTLIHKEEGSVCEKLIGNSQDIHDTSFSLNKTVMAVWTVTVPANQCFKLSFYFLHQRRHKDNYGDKITILDGELRPPVVTTSRIFEYQRPQKNETTTVSLVYYFTSFSKRLYWRMAATLGCMC